MKARRLLAGSLLLIVAAAVVIAVVRPPVYLRVVLPLAYESFITAHAANYDVDPALIAAVINVESDFNPGARSEAGAVGLMQLTPETGQGIADRTGGATWTTEDLLDPELNIRYGAWYLAHLATVFEDQDDPELAALAAYNAGQGNVREWSDAAGGDLAVGDIEFDETRAYVEDVRRLEREYRRAFPALKPDDD